MRYDMHAAAVAAVATTPNASPVTGITSLCSATPPHTAAPKTMSVHLHKCTHSTSSSSAQANKQNSVHQSTGWMWNENFAPKHKGFFSSQQQVKASRDGSQAYTYTCIHALRFTWSPPYSTHSPRCVFPAFAWIVLLFAPALFGCMECIGLDSNGWAWAQKHFIFIFLLYFFLFPAVAAAIVIAVDE